MINNGKTRGKQSEYDATILPKCPTTVLSPQSRPERVGCPFFMRWTAGVAGFPMHMALSCSSQYCVTKSQNTFTHPKTSDWKPPSSKYTFHYVLSTFLGPENCWNISNKDFHQQSLPERVGSWFFTHWKDWIVGCSMHIASSRSSQYCVATWQNGSEPFSGGVFVFIIAPKLKNWKYKNRISCPNKCCHQFIQAETQQCPVSN